MHFNLWPSQSFWIRILHPKPYSSICCKVQGSPNCPLAWCNILFHLKKKIYGEYPWINILLILTFKWLWRLNSGRFNLYRCFCTLCKCGLLHLQLYTCLLLGRGNGLTQSMDLPWDQGLLFIKLCLYSLCWGCLLQPTLPLCVQCSL